MKAIDETYLMNDEPLQGQWTAPEEAPSLSSSCTGHGRKGWVVHWEYPLGKLAPGDYRIRTTVVLKHPVTDGWNSDGAGKPDFYAGTLYDDVEITIHVVMPAIVASVRDGGWMWTTQLAAQTDLAISVYDSLASWEGRLAPSWEGTSPTTDDGGFTWLSFPDSGFPVVPGNYLTVSDGITTKGLVLEAVSVDVFDTANDVMAGTAPAGVNVWVAAGPQEWQKGMLVPSDPETGAWTADFKTLIPPFNFEEYMCTWSYAQVFDADGDINEGDPRCP